MEDDYITAQKSNIESLLEEILAEIKNQHELDRINNTVLARRLGMKDIPTPASEE